ncbi:MAG: peptide chain release factor N(5)-glutamine methyltransferase, partial [Proteobacteria bacterium]|nr:peptide chain release factor N(5)-glutamine methyltransferase [Pseudomonadota bacterium]
MILQEFLRDAGERLEKACLHFADSHQHAEQIVLRTLNLSPTELFLKKDQALKSSDLEKLKSVLERRLSGEPLQYILGFEYFYESKFEVGPGCLIPRRETELLVDEVLGFELSRSLKVSELGAGTGNIGISVLLKRQNIEWHAFEINSESAVYTKKNIAVLLPKNSQYFLHGEDFFEGAGRFSPYDVIVSNPPYISFEEYAELSQEVKQEPELALKAGEEGLDVIRKLVSRIPVLLKPGGLFLCEIGASQEEKVKQEFNRGPWDHFEILKDLAGHPRVLKIK